MIISSPKMSRMMSKFLKEYGGLYTLDDIIKGIYNGKFQSHVFGDSWVITQVDQFPRDKVVHLTGIVGTIDELRPGFQELYKWSKEIGAIRITGNGRDGWWGPAKNEPGWRRVGTMYEKDLTDG